VAFWKKLLAKQAAPSSASAGHETPEPVHTSRALRVPIGGTTVGYSQGEDLKPLFFVSVMGSQWDAVKMLLKDGNDPGMVCVRGKMFHETPLHWAAKSGQTDVVELLLAHSADINAVDSDGQTPLQWALAEGDNKMAELLRQHGGV